MNLLMSQKGKQLWNRKLEKKKPWTMEKERTQTAAEDVSHNDNNL
mgnify:CR=1 FL=1